VLTGRINSLLEAVISLSIRGPEGRVLEVDATVDTGFSGTLSLPPEMVGALRLLPFGTMLGTLADGSQSVFPVYTAIVFWHGKPRLTYVSVVESEPLLGMDMLHGSEFSMQVVEGGEVAIQELGSF
jgi:clan AA aspartic protease